MSYIIRLWVIHSFLEKLFPTCTQIMEQIISIIHKWDNLIMNRCDVWPNSKSLQHLTTLMIQISHYSSPTQCLREELCWFFFVFGAFIILSSWTFTPDLVYCLTTFSVIISHPFLRVYLSCMNLSCSVARTLGLSSFLSQAHLWSCLSTVAPSWGVQR